ncbi:hypothetical protein SASPL_108877 [Salvia splendens]|uniref:Uncharacterized protein n=1 Tax=Salvia splendens TaxID=180675 RepID=A0A8X8YFH5_SALSN|nr:hypothetical protein SASPL_108877 [Salvia splendens]
MVLSSHLELAMLILYACYSYDGDWCTDLPQLLASFDCPNSEACCRILLSLLMLIRKFWGCLLVARKSGKADFIANFPIFCGRYPNLFWLDVADEKGALLTFQLGLLWSGEQGSSWRRFP